MKYLDRDKVIYQMDKENNPALIVKEGSVVTVRTYDCFNGRLLAKESAVGDIDFNELNPATGPIYIEGAEPGDTLRIEVLDICLDAIGVTEIDQEFGCLASRISKAQILHLPVDETGIHFSEKLKLKASPMIGVIGVAPKGEPVPTDTPDIHGGNMDCAQIGKGTLLYLPVFTKGGLLALGDLHACMGDGEIGGCGAEIAGEVTLKLSVLHGRQKPYPVIIANDTLHVIASKPTVEGAWQEAASLLHEYVVQETGLSSDEAVMLLSLAGDLAVCQTVNPNKTVRMSIPLYCLKAYGYQIK